MAGESWKIFLHLFIHLILILFSTKVDLRIIEIQCKARCIDEMKRKPTANYKAISCISPNCKLCSRFCHLDVRSNSNCSSHCSATVQYSICNSTCLFLKEKIRKGLKPGECPKVLSGFELAQVARCQQDEDCPWSEKCCLNRRIKTCQIAEYIFNTSYPPIPIDVKALRKSPSETLLQWKLPANTTWRNGTIFVVEKRQSSRMLVPSNYEFSFWGFAGQTSELRIILRGLTPGDWYQFRIAAYSKDGTNGFSSPSFPIKLNAEIRRPSRPRRIDAQKAWFDKGRIFVNITWQPPLILDLPVRRYRIIYNRDVHGSGQHYDPVRENRLKVSGKRTHTILPRLHPDTIYVVKIQALITHKGQKIRGRWGKTFLKIPPLLNTTQTDTSGKSTLLPSSAGLPTVTMATIKTTISIFCKRVFMNDNGYLSALLLLTVPDTVEGIELEYRPNKCRNVQRNMFITKKRAVNGRKKEIILKDLYPFCAYTVKMTPYYTDRTADKERSISFSTDISNLSTMQPTKLLKSGQYKVPSSSPNTFKFQQLTFLIGILNVVVLIL